MLLAVLPPISNKASFIEAVEVRDNETNELVDLAGHEIFVEMRAQGDCSPVLTASIDLGNVAILDLGVFQFSFTAAQMRGLPAATYDLGAIVSFADEISQLIIATVPVLDGIVRATS